MRRGGTVASPLPQVNGSPGVWSAAGKNPLGPPVAYCWNTTVSAFTVHGARFSENVILTTLPCAIPTATPEAPSPGLVDTTVGSAPGTWSSNNAGSVSRRVWNDEAADAWRGAPERLRTDGPSGAPRTSTRYSVSGCRPESERSQSPGRRGSKKTRSASMMYFPKTAAPKEGPSRIWIEDGSMLPGSTGPLNRNSRTRLSGTLSWPDCRKFTRIKPLSEWPDPELPDPPPPQLVVASANPAARSGAARERARQFWRVTCMET